MAARCRTSASSIHVLFDSVQAPRAGPGRYHSTLRAANSKQGSRLPALGPSNFAVLGLSSGRSARAAHFERRLVGHGWLEAARLAFGWLECESNSVLVVLQ